MSSNSTTSSIDDSVQIQAERAETSDQTAKLQVAIGLFDQPTNLAAALQELLSQGFAVTDLCVSGSQDAVSMAGSVIQKRQNVNSKLISLFDHTEPYDTPAEFQSAVGSQGKLFNLLNQTIIRRKNNHLDPVYEECSKIIAELETHIHQGRLVLIVETGESQQTIHASRVLLHHSPHNIQTHEFRVTQW